MSKTNMSENPNSCKNCNYWKELADNIGVCDNEDGEYFDHFTIRRDHCPDWKGDKIDKDKG